MRLFKSRTHEEFLDQFKAARPDAQEYTFESEYVASRAPITSRHTVCGNVFETRPHLMLKADKHCPFCQVAKPQKKVSDSTSRSDLQRFGFNRFTLVKNEYVEGANLMTIQHTVCSSKFVITRKALLQYGIACPHCSYPAFLIREESRKGEMRRLESKHYANLTEEEAKRLNKLVTEHVFEGSFGRYIVLSGIDPVNKTVRIIDKKTQKERTVRYSTLLKQVKEIIAFHDTGHYIKMT